MEVIFLSSIPVMDIGIWNLIQIHFFCTEQIREAIVYIVIEEVEFLIS